ncbi:hypothetical protein K402DRAFT_465313 [Aulographum hederae CBS 113979]|uniref:F-box domain-containing protein n=1 Tax=Aulographum hederae CBS 113979 TaxID=1176131 RepID=A0A6G1GTV1_9PEZI|nr:hypothetical protein K402DRAFT_465313 [Aulographum hederae CBS 113979]
MEARSSHNEPGCKFLTLPAELRIKIYHLVLPKNHTFRITAASVRGARTYPFLPSLSILLTNQQIHSEALREFHAMNRIMLVIDGGQAAHTWKLEFFDSPILKRVKHLRIDFIYSPFGADDYVCAANLAEIVKRLVAVLGFYDEERDERDKLESLEINYASPAATLVPCSKYFDTILLPFRKLCLKGDVVFCHCHATHNWKPWYPAERFSEYGVCEVVKGVLEEMRARSVEFKAWRHPILFPVHPGLG